MNNFGRVVRLALHYRFTFIVSIITALLVGLLWGANIGVVFPIIKVAFENESPQQWLESEIVGAHKKIADKRSQIEQWEGQLAAAEGDEARIISNRILVNQDEITAEEHAIDRYLWFQPYVDSYLPSDPFMALAIFIGFLLLGTIAKDGFLICNTILVARLSHLATFNLRKIFYRRILRMDMASFTKEGTSELMSRFTYDMEQLAMGLVALFGKLVREPIKAIVCLAGAAYICWRLLFLSLVVAPLAGLMIHWLAKTLKRANRKAMEEMAQLYNTLEETFRGIKIVKAFTMERHERRRFHHNSKKFYRKTMKIARYDSLTHPVTEVMGVITICLALLAGAYLVLSNETHLFGIRMSDRPLSLAALLTFYGLLAGMADPFRKMSNIFTHMQRASAAADRIYAMVDRESQVRNPQKALALPRHRQDLVFDGVDFSYEPDRPILKSIDLHINFGETVALVGPNGCGKSTLASLISRFADPDAGEIRLDGINLKDARICNVRGQVGLVSQETLLFDDTIENNIRYGSPLATHEQVVEAAKQAYAHQFIENELCDGYQTVAGPLGSRLSGGQRQRIALARAILHDPAILILDEATSQVDLESEQLIQRALEKFVRGRTTVIITHRMGVLAMADRIVVMENGGILDVGTHEELLGRCGLYNRLYSIQFENNLRDSA
ncbi:MAG: ABC transporter ATP-binding protein [Planctomycetota bacterium]|nr:ABC transporter ATP-binding protein [Planctomycetota bacterium]